MSPLPPIMRVTWIDSSHSMEEIRLDETVDFPRPVTISTVGFVVERSDEYVTLAREIMGDHAGRSLISIPAVCIISEETMGQKARAR